MNKKILIIIACLLIPCLSQAQCLTKAQVSDLQQSLTQQWKDSIRRQLADQWSRKVVTINHLEMPYWLTVYGKEPADGRSLWISLHGGGNAHQAVNDQQWENQRYLYQPAEGVYIAPRAPYNDWDMWCKSALDGLYHQLIEMCVATLNVNPDKVYILGYSAGGDGVWRMAPRMADNWAAASMMAGHPGNVSMLNLRNLPYMIWCGALDAAYDRNKLDTYRGQQIDSLHAADPEGYLHETHIMAGKAHWMDRADTAAIAWMAQYKRNPYPTKIIWRQEEVVRPDFYWLSAPRDQLKWGNTVRLSCHDNTVDISQCDYSSLTLWLNDELVDLDRKVTVRYKGHTVFKGKLQRTPENMKQSLSERGDPSYIFPARVTIRL